MDITTPLLVGQSLYWVPRLARNNQCSLVTIEKIGRKWVTLSNGHRIDKQNFVADSGDYSSPGRCYQDKSTYDAILAKSSAWNRLRQKVAGTYHPPTNISAQDIERATEILFHARSADQ